MKKLFIGFLTLVFAFTFLLSANPAEAASRVRGYVKKNGTIVRPYFKSTPDKSRFNNFSTKGNINPYTGKKGTVNPLKPSIRRSR